MSVVDLPCSSLSWPPSGSRGRAGRPVWTLVGWGWHSAVGGPWWSGSRSSACTGAASAASRGHRTRCTLTMHWPPSYNADSWMSSMFNFGLVLEKGECGLCAVKYQLWKMHKLFCGKIELFLTSGKLWGKKQWLYSMYPFNVNCV